MPIELRTLDHVYSKEEVAGLREVVIELRNAALEAANFDYAVSLSHVVAVMSIVLENME